MSGSLSLATVWREEGGWRPALVPRTGRHEAETGHRTIDGDGGKALGYRRNRQGC